MSALPRVEPLGDRPAFPFCSHIDERGLWGQSFRALFDAGDELFDTQYVTADGVGANLSWDADVSIRFSRVPRADLKGWVGRATGPNGRSCASCHSQPVDDGAGDSAMDVFRDPYRTGDLHKYIRRNTTHVMGLGALQRLAEEMTEELAWQRQTAAKLAKTRGRPVWAEFHAKGIDYGGAVVSPYGELKQPQLKGIDKDLVVKPFQWKGSVASVRDFVIDASNNEIGMQAVEFFGENVDPDGDGVPNELSVGDVTALTVYVAGTARPTTKLELEKMGGAEPLSYRERIAIQQGQGLFAKIGCTECHTPEMRIRNPQFCEPSPLAAYRHDILPNGVPALAVGLDYQHPHIFDLTKDPSVPLAVDPATGQAIVQLYSDLRRHDLGPALAEPVDEVKTGASVFLTRPLWGVGSTAPYLHDGRAPTLTDAIRLHGGEASTSRAQFNALSPDDKAAVIEFLKNLVLFKPNVQGGG